MTYEEARDILLKDFHKTRYTEKVSVDPQALGLLLYGEPKRKEYSTSWNPDPKGPFGDF